MSQRDKVNGQGRLAIGILKVKHQFSYWNY